jgi:uncharacterized DUF497 family protein
MEFEFDPRKNDHNIMRHGVDFIEAQLLRKVEHIILPLREVDGEWRHANLGMLDGELHLAVFTWRDGRVRLISCHRADRRWEKIYAQELKKA